MKVSELTGAALDWAVANCIFEGTALESAMRCYVKSKLDDNVLPEGL